MGTGAFLVGELERRERRVHSPLFAALRKRRKRRAGTTIDICYIAADAKSFKESEHPRGQPENKGEFVKKGAGSAPATAAPSMPKNYHVGAQLIQQFGAHPKMPVSEKIDTIKKIAASYKNSAGVQAHAAEWLKHLGAEPSPPPVAAPVKKAPPSLKTAPVAKKTEKPAAAQTLADFATSKVKPSKSIDGVVYSRSLTAAEKDAVASYKGPGYEIINDYLRTGEVLPGNEEYLPRKSFFKKLESAFEKGTLTRNFELYRGMEVNRADPIAKLQPGQSTQDPAPLSTSVDRKIAEKFADSKHGVPLIMTIKAKAGTKAVAVEDFRNLEEEYEGFGEGAAGDEKEVLLKPDQELTCLSREVKDGVIHLVLETKK